MSKRFPEPSIGRVESYLREQVLSKGCICVALVDSENISPQVAAQKARRSEGCGISAILVGGSTIADQIELDAAVRAIKMVVTVPVILFPGNITGVSPSADAILFSSLLNSDNPYFITEAQALSALYVKRHSLEAIPMGYLIIGPGGSTGFIGRARGIPPDRPQLAAMYALAAKYLGMRFLYLEAGSGVTSHVSTKIVSAVRQHYDGLLMVGGGITMAGQAVSLASSGADILVIGSILEREPFAPTLAKIIQSVTSNSKPSRKA